MLFGITLTVMSAHGVQADSSLSGSWIRTAKYVNGTLETRQPATLVISETSYSSVTTAPPEDECAFTGNMTVRNRTIRVTVRVSTCPDTIPVNSLRIYRYSVSDDSNTLTTTTAAGNTNLKQIYKRTTGRKGKAGAAQACNHPICGTWNRTATYVNGILVNNTPAYTVITQKTYYSIAPACYNALEINSIQGNTFTMTMVNHNCPTPPGGPMGPGTVVNQTFSLTEGGDILTIINTEYGAEVKTVFRRLR